MNSLLINNPLKAVSKIIIRYDSVIFIVIVTVGLIASILMLNDILNRPYSNGSKSGNSSTIFDTQTINSLNQLQSSAVNTSYKTLPPGRVSPFSE
jgi:hypothetical protein